MTGKEFLHAVANGETDLLQVLLDVLEETGAGHCVIGGLAVNAYAEPVVSLDLDLVGASRPWSRSAWRRRATQSLRRHLRPSLPKASSGRPSPGAAHDGTN